MKIIVYLSLLGHHQDEVGPPAPPPPPPGAGGAPPPAPPTAVPANHHHGKKCKLVRESSPKVSLISQEKLNENLSSLRCNGSVRSN